MLKILFLTDEPWDSGITHYVLQISNAFKEKGHHVTVGVRENSKPEKYAKEMGLNTVTVQNPSRTRLMIL